MRLGRRTGSGSDGGRFWKDGGGYAATKACLASLWLIVVVLQVSDAEVEVFSPQQTRTPARCLLGAALSGCVGTTEVGGTRIRG